MRLAEFRLHYYRQNEYRYSLTGSHPLEYLLKQYKINTGKENLMNRKDYLIAKKLKEKLSEVAIVDNLTVFGSRAKGNADEYSDLDVSIVVASLNKELKEKILDIVWEVGFDNLVVISPIIFTIDEIENSPLRSAPIVKNILEEGVRI